MGSVNKLLKNSSTKLSYEDLEDIVVGSSILASGGGGASTDAFDIAKRIFRKGFSPRIVPGSAVKDKDLVFTTTDVGGGMSKEGEERFERVYKQKSPLRGKRFPLEKWSPVAIRELASYLGKEPDVFLCLELGPRFIEVLEHAARDDKPLVDGDTTGRAVPELPMSTLFMKNAPYIAAASTSHFGDAMFLKRTMDYRRMDDIVRAFAVSSGGGAGLAIALTGKSMNSCLLKGTLVECLDAGHAVRNLGLVDAVEKHLRGKILFKGRHEELKMEMKDGHFYGEHFLSGSGDFQGKEMKIWAKNENHIAWIDDKVIATSPDIITMVDPERPEGLWNFATIPKDRDLYVVGIPSPKFWKTKKGLELLSPRAFGFDFDYVPVR